MVKENYMGWMLLGEKENNEVMGDEPWDVMGAAVEKIIEIYQRDWDRNPTRNEIEKALEFVMPDDME